MPGETTLKFVLIFYSIIKIAELISISVSAYCLESLYKIVGKDDKKIALCAIVFNYVALGGAILGAFTILTKNCCPQKMMKVRYTEYVFFGVNIICIFMNIILSIMNISKLEDEEENRKSIKTYNLVLVFLLGVAFFSELFGVVCEERQMFLLKKKLNSIQVPPVVFDPQGIEDEIESASDMPPSYEETCPENMEPPPPYRWVVCENFGVGFTSCASSAAGCFAKKSDKPLVQSNEMNTTQESNIHLADTIQESQSVEADPTLEASSPDVDFASSSLEFVPTTTSSEDQAQETSLSEGPSEAISGKNEASKNISKENTSEETSLSQEKTSNKKSVGKSDQKTHRSREDERTETDLTNPEEEKKDDSSLETESSDQ